MKDVVDYVKNCGGIEYAIERGKMYSEKAKNNLNFFEDHAPIKKVLLNFIDFNTNRNN